MPIFLGFVAFVIAFVVDYIVARKFESIAFDKGYTRSAGAFWMCFFLGPIGYIYVAAMPMLTPEQIEGEETR